MNYLLKIFQELRRRKMFKPMAFYASFAFIAIQVTDVIVTRLFFRMCSKASGPISFTS